MPDETPKPREPRRRRVSVSKQTKKVLEAGGPEAERVAEIVELVTKSENFKSGLRLLIKKYGISDFVIDVDPNGQVRLYSGIPSLLLGAYSLRPVGKKAMAETEKEDFLKIVENLAWRGDTDIRKNSQGEILAILQDKEKYGNRFQHLNISSIKNALTAIRKRNPLRQKPTSSYKKKKETTRHPETGHGARQEIFTEDEDEF